MSQLPTMTESRSGETPLGGPRGVVIGFNPASGSGDRRSKVERVAGLLADRGLDVQLTTEIGRATELAVAGHQDGSLRAFVAVGGDGTVRTMTELLPTGLPIAIYPLGTENLLARHLGIDRSESAVVEAVVGGEERWLDAGLANGQLFLVMASCGFDADVVHRTHGRRKGHIQRWNYLLPAFESIWNYPYAPLHVSVDDGQQLRPARWAFVFNVPRYAMNLPIAPDADPQDGLLDVCTFRRGSLLPGLAYIATIFMRRHRAWTTGQHVQSKSVLIESPQPVPYQLDGDPGGWLPLRIETLPRRARFLVAPRRPAPAKGR
jgi:diacylglycerol kinase (ATP)